MERAEALSALSTGLAAGTLPERDKEFATSLVEQAGKRGLSEKQWYWVARLAAKLAGGPEPSVQNFEKAYALFKKAGEHLKHPKVVLRTASGRNLKLYVSGLRSRVPNTVNVIDADSGNWYGRVYENGRWERGTATEGVQEVEALLNAFATDPETVAAAYGKLTGNCCFCSRGLTDERSTAVGYGPVCASRFGLTWGTK